MMQAYFPRVWLDIPQACVCQKQHTVHSTICPYFFTFAVIQSISLTASKYFIDTAESKCTSAVVCQALIQRGQIGRMVSILFIYFSRNQICYCCLGM